MNENPKRQRFDQKKLLFDLCLILALLLFFGVISLFVASLAPRGNTAVVTLDGEEIFRVSLRADGEYPLNGGTNTLLIAGGKASIIHAQCPDRFCERQGEIDRVGQKIICLPHRLTVEIVGERGEQDPDLILFSPAKNSSSEKNPAENLPSEIRPAETVSAKVVSAKVIFTEVVPAEKGGAP